MRWKQWLLGFGVVMLLIGSVSLPVSALDTVPELPILTESQDETTETASEAPLPSAVSASYNDNKMLLLGIGAWVAFLLLIGIVAVVLINSRKHPPGGPTSGKGKMDPEQTAEKERMLSDQHYRRY